MNLTAAKILADELSKYRAELNEQLNGQHLEVCQRLTKIETTIKNSGEAFSSIPGRIAKLENFDEKVKVMGSIAGAGLSAAWATMLVWMRKG